MNTINVTNWSAQEFLGLLRNLTKIPAHFYAPSKGKKNVDFALIDLPEGFWKQEGHIPLQECYCSKGAEHPRVLIGKKAAAPEVVHDLVHRATDASLEELSRQLFLALKVNDFGSIQARFAAEEGPLAFGATDIREFFSVGGEYYVQGREKFMEAYRQFFNEEEAEALYQFLKEKIFKE